MKNIWIFKKIIFPFILIISVGLTFSYANVQPKPEDVSQLIKPVVSKYHVPGMIVAVISHDSIKALGAYGVRKSGTNNKITINDIFHIGSDTKSMTATLLAILVQKKLMHWDTKVVDVFPKLKEKINPAFKDLTLEQLLTMRGGVVSNINYDPIQLATKNNLVKARQIATETALSQPPEVKPGLFNYSNMSYIIAGHMAEKMTGHPWEFLMRTYIFSPLKLQSAGFGPPSPANSIEQPIGHHENGKPISLKEYGDNPEILGPAGTVHLSIFDWIKYIQTHLKAMLGISQTILKLNPFQKLHTPIKNPPPPYAMGWIVDNMQWAKGSVFTHAGSNELWYAKVWIAPKRDLAILIMINQGGKKASKASNIAGAKLMQYFLNLPKGVKIDNSK